MTARAGLLGAVFGLLMASPVMARPTPAASQPVMTSAPAPAASPMPGSAGSPASRIAVPAAALAAPPATAAAAADDIRDIRGPKPITSPWLVWEVIGAAVLAVLLGYALWRWIKRRQRIPEKRDFEIALERLQVARTLMQPGRGREFSIEVSGIVREYIERRFKVMAAHRTTHEFLHDLIDSADPGLAAQRELLGEFLQSCDLAKFGGWNLSIDQMDSMLESARRFIQSAAAAPAQSQGAPAEAPDSHSPSPKSETHVSVPTT